MDIKVQFGRSLRAQRLKSQFTQEQLAEEADLDRTYISGLERGIRNPTIAIVAQLAKALNVNPATLLGKNGKS